MVTPAAHHIKEYRDGALGAADSRPAPPELDTLLLQQLVDRTVRQAAALADLPRVKSAGVVCDGFRVIFDVVRR